MNKIEADIAKKVDISFSTSIDTGGQTILHCKLLCDPATLIRIWPTTILVDNLDNTYKLLHFENIYPAPFWFKPNLINNFAYFTLIFERLSNDASLFFLTENIEESNGFYTDFITKNKSGVYNNVQILTA